MWPDKRYKKLFSKPMYNMIGLQDKIHSVIWQHHHRYWKVSYNVFLLISSDQEHWQCVCSRYIQQNSLLTLVSGKHDNSSIGESGRLQPLLNQAYQFHTGFHHHISITWLSASNLLFLTCKARQSLRTNMFSNRQSHSCWHNTHTFEITGYLH